LLNSWFLFLQLNLNTFPLFWRYYQ
jgi:hypothetical protein